MLCRAVPCPQVPQEHQAGANALHRPAAELQAEASQGLEAVHRGQHVQQGAGSQHGLQGTGRRVSVVVLHVLTAALAYWPLLPYRWTAVHVLQA